MNQSSDVAGGTNVIVAAVQWLSGTLLGSLATTLAVIAVASVGFLLLSGRIDVRRAVQVIFACFILFGASTLASGFMAILQSSAEPVATIVPPAPVVSPSLPVQPARANSPYDPYAGAALPAHR